MAKLQIKRGTTSSISSYSISVGEVLLNTTKNSLIIGDSNLAKREISLLPVSPITNTYLNSSGNWVNIQDASATISGIINLTNQTFSGEKTFSSKLNINSPTESILSMTSENASNVYIDLLRIGSGRYSWRISNTDGSFEIITFLTSNPATQTSKFKISYNGGITIGEWKATTISPQYGGTGLNNIPVGEVIIGNGTSTPTTVGFDTIATLNSNKLMTSDSIYRNIYNGKTGYSTITSPGWYRMIHNQSIESSASSMYFTIRTSWNHGEPTNINCILTMNGIGKGAQLTILSCSGHTTDYINNHISKIRVVYGSTITNPDIYIDIYYNSSMINYIYASVYQMAPYSMAYEVASTFDLAPDIPTGYTSVEATVRDRIYGNELGDFVSGSLSASKTLTVTNNGIDPNVTFSSQSSAPVSITLDRGNATNYQITNNGTLRILCDYITSKVPYFEILRIDKDYLDVIRNIRPMTDNYSDLGTSSLKFKNIYAYNIISDTYTGEICGADTRFTISGSGWRRLYTLNTTFANPQTSTASVIFRLHSRYSYNGPCSATFQIETRYASAPIITMINGTRGAGVLHRLRAVYSSTDATILHIDAFFGNSNTNIIALTTIYNDKFLNVYDGTIITEDQSPLSVYDFPITIDGMIINTNLTLIDGNSSQVCRLGDFGIFNRMSTRITSGFDTISDSGLYDSAPDPTAFNTSLYTQIAQFTSADTNYAIQIASTMTGYYQEYGIRRKSIGNWKPWANLLTSANSPLTESSFITASSEMGWYKIMSLRMTIGRTHGHHITLLVTDGRCATAMIEIVVQSIDNMVRISSSGSATPAYMKIIRMHTPNPNITSFDPAHFKLMYECDTYPNPKIGSSYVELWVYSVGQNRSYQFDVLSTHSYNLDTIDTISNNRDYNVTFIKNPIKETTGNIAPLLEGTSWGSIPLTYGIIKQDVELNSPIVINGNISTIANMSNFNGYSIIKNGRTFVDTKNIACVGDSTSWSFSILSNNNLLVTKNTTADARHIRFFLSKEVLAGEKHLIRMKFKTSLTKTGNILAYYTSGTTSTSTYGTIVLGNTIEDTWSYIEIVTTPNSTVDSISITSTARFNTIGETIEIEYIECTPITMDNVPIMRDTATGTVYKLNINNGVLGIVQL